MDASLSSSTTNTTRRNDDAQGSWFYYLKQDPLHKPDGWYPYDSSNSDEVEQLYMEFLVTNRADRFSTRSVHSESSGFTYKVDLAEMKQANTQSGTVRPIRRTRNGRPPQ